MKHLLARLPGVSYQPETLTKVGYMLIREQLQRVEDEITLLKQLSHPNIISLKDSWEDKERYEIVLITDFVSGGTLSQ